LLLLSTGRAAGLDDLDLASGVRRQLELRT